MAPITNVAVAEWVCLDQRRRVQDCFDTKHCCNSEGLLQVNDIFLSGKHWREEERSIVCSRSRPVHCAPKSNEGAIRDACRILPDSRCEFLRRRASVISSAERCSVSNSGRWPLGEWQTWSSQANSAGWLPAREWQRFCRLGGGRSGGVARG